MVGVVGAVCVRSATCSVDGIIVPLDAEQDRGAVDQSDGGLGDRSQEVAGGIQ